MTAIRRYAMLLGVLAALPFLLPGSSGIASAQEQTTPSTQLALAQPPIGPPVGPRGQEPIVPKRIFGLTQAEQHLLVLNPSKVAVTKQMTDKTLADIKKLFGGDPKDGTAGNAVKHAYWNALLSKHSDDQWAKKFTDAHESEALEKTPNNSNMDLHNNAQGRTMVFQNRGLNEQQLLDRINKLPKTFIDIRGKNPDQVKQEMRKVRGLVYIVQGAGTTGRKD